MKDKTQSCLVIENNKTALACLKKVISEFPDNGGCKPKLVLLVSNDCDPCDEETALHKADIEKGIIQKITFNSPEGRAIAQKNNISTVPSLILLDCYNNLILPEE